MIQTQEDENIFTQIQAPFAPIMEPLSQPIFHVGGSPVTLMSVVMVILILIITFVISGLVRRVTKQAFKRRGVEEGVVYAVNRLIHYGILALGLFLALDNIGINLTGLAAFGAIIGVGIGFGLQNIAQNFVSGLILLLERPVKRGDFVLVGQDSEIRGTVQDIRARATVVTTLDNVDILVPNSQFINEQVVNQTYGDRRLRGQVRVGVAYGSDTEKVRDILLRIASEHPEVHEDPPPTVRFLDFGDSSLDFVVYFMIGNPRRVVPIESDIRFSIDKAFREAQVEIPFPQRDLHIRSGLEPVARRDPNALPAA